MNYKAAQVYFFVLVGSAATIAVSCAVAANASNATVQNQGTTLAQANLGTGGNAKASISTQAKPANLSPKMPAAPGASSAVLNAKPSPNASGGVKTAPAPGAGSNAALGPTTMAMQGGLTFVFQLPVGFALKQRTKAAPNCDTMVWMKPDTVTENDGALYELSVISPSESMQNDMQSAGMAKLAQELLAGKSESWREFHRAEPREVSMGGLKFVRIDFNGARKEDDPKLSGFQLLAEFNDKVVCAVVQGPDQAKTDVQAFDDAMKTMQVQ